MANSQLNNDSAESCCDNESDYSGDGEAYFSSVHCLWPQPRLRRESNLKSAKEHQRSKITEKGGPEARSTRNRELCSFRYLYFRILDKFSIYRGFSEYFFKYPSLHITRRQLPKAHGFRSLSLWQPAQFWRLRN